MATVFEVRETTTGTGVQTVLDEQGYATKTLTRSFTISLDSGTTEDVISVEQSAQALGTPELLPRLRESHPTYTYLTATDVSTKRTSTIFYETQVTYTSPASQEGEEQSQPLDMTAKISYSTIRSEVEIDSDYDGIALRNLGTEKPFSLITERSDLAINIVKNYASFNPLSIYTYNDKVNSDGFLIPGASGPLPAGVAKIDNIDATTATHEGAVYWVVTVSIIIREPMPGIAINETWYHRRQHVGYYALKGTKASATSTKAFQIGTDKDGAYQPYPDKGVTPLSTPTALNENGTIRLPGDGDPYFQMIKTKGSISFTSLGLF